MNDNVYEIMSALEDKVNEIFLAEQEKRGITSGDTDPMMEYGLGLKMEELAEMINDILTAQEM
jgi:hypothetical protein